MKIVAIIGSPRAGNTLKAVKEIEETLTSIDKTIQFSIIELKDTSIRKCIGCFKCLEKGAGFCPLKKDKRDWVIDKIEKADGLILASPVYVMNVSGIMKNFIDRLSYICHRPRFYNCNVMAVSTSAAIGQKEVAKYLADVGTIWGCRAKTTLGVPAPPKGGDFNFTTKDLEEIHKQSLDFYHKLKEPFLKPSFRQILQFRVQRAIFSSPEMKDQMPRDFKFWSKLKGEKYYISTAKTNHFYNILGSLIGISARTKIKKNFRNIKK